MPDFSYFRLCKLKPNSSNVLNRWTKHKLNFNFHKLAPPKRKQSVKLRNIQLSTDRRTKQAQSDTLHSLHVESNMVKQVHGVSLYGSTYKIRGCQNVLQQYHTKYNTLSFTGPQQIQLIVDQLYMEDSTSVSFKNKKLHCDSIFYVQAPY